jgi:hypothetical protein
MQPNPYVEGAGNGNEDTMASSERTEGTATPGTEAGTTPGTEAGTTPGTEAGTEAGTTPGTEAGTEAGPPAYRKEGFADPPGPMAKSPGPVARPLERARISCDMNARYHACREAFLDTVHRWFMFGIIAFGAAAIVDVLPHGWEWLRGGFGAGAAILGALDLTFDLSNRARMHALMKRRYFELLADVIEGRKNLEAMQAAINRFNADEEPAYHALLGSCWNAAQKMVYGQAAIELHVPRRHLLAKNWMRFASSNYRPKTPAKNLV